jgi:hypothetical protein
LQASKVVAADIALGNHASAIEGGIGDGIADIFTAPGGFAAQRSPKPNPDLHPHYSPSLHHSRESAFHPDQFTPGCSIRNPAF